MVATFVSFLFSAALAHAGVEEALLRVQFANSALQNGLYSCPERVWPGVNWAATSVMFISRDANKAWLISPGMKDPQTLPLSRDMNAVTDFKISNFRGKTVVMVNLDKYIHEKISMPTAVAIHELFHQVGQAGWKMPAPKRGDLYPLLAPPRVARAMILHELQKYAHGEASALGRAALWFAKWKSEAPEEILFETDAREGTAKYVERAAIELASVGCAGDLNRALTQWAQEQSALSFVGLDAEGYVLGAFAALLLEQRGGGAWREAVKNGLSPLELLFVNVPATPAHEDAVLRGNIESRIATINGEVAQLVDPLAASAEADSYRIVIPDSWIGPNVNLLGIFLPRTSPDQTYMVFTYGQEFKSGRQNWMVLTSPSLGLTRGDGFQQPCGKGGVEFVVAKSHVTRKGNQYAGHTNNLDFEITARAVVSRNGLSYLCPVTN